jgi:hypothetical protein
MAGEQLARHRQAEDAAADDEEVAGARGFAHGRPD